MNSRDEINSCASNNESTNQQEENFIPLFMAAHLLVFGTEATLDDYYNDWKMAVSEFFSAEGWMDVDKPSDNLGIQHCTQDALLEVVAGHLRILGKKEPLDKASELLAFAHNEAGVRWLGVRSDRQDRGPEALTGIDFWGLSLCCVHGDISDEYNYTWRDLKVARTDVNRIRAEILERKSLLWIDRVPKDLIRDNAEAKPKGNCEGEPEFVASSDPELVRTLREMKAAGLSLMKYTVAARMVEPQGSTEPRKKRLDARLARVKRGWPLIERIWEALP